MKTSFVILFRLVKKKKNRSHHLNLIIEIDSVYLKLIPALLTSTDIEVSNKSISTFFYNSLLFQHTHSGLPDLYQWTEDQIFVYEYLEVSLLSAARPGIKMNSK